MEYASEKVKIHLALSRGMEAPVYATPGSAAVDLRAALEPDELWILEPGQTKLIPTGISMAPETAGVVGIIAARSGLSIKSGIAPANAIGVIDSDYRGEICVGLHNFSKKPFEIRRGDRIAQLLFMPVYQADFLIETALDETERGCGGFGSTGTK